MIVRKCKTITEAISAALSISLDWGNKNKDPTTDIWYRGVKDNTHNLIPSAYYSGPNVDEYSRFISFKQVVRNLIDTSNFDNWDFYCLARHHGLPTRHLDWTEGLMQALFFAFDSWDTKTTPCIWMLRPHLLNKISTGEEYIYEPSAHIKDESDTATSFWLPPIVPKKKNINKNNWNNKFPIAIYPARTNARIIGQLGVFTIHGCDKIPINHFIKSKCNSDEILARIDLVNFNADITRSLWYLGLRNVVFYPDVDHLTKDIQYAFYKQ
jgi:hypothetical protein